MRHNHEILTGFRNTVNVSYQRNVQLEKFIPDKNIFALGDGGIYPTKKGIYLTRGIYIDIYL